jgi:Aminotransferase class I and II
MKSGKNTRNISVFDPRFRVSSVVCPGTQNALFNLLVALTKPRDVVLTESLTYPGIKAAAAYTGVRLIGLPIDEAGILPDALNSACREHAPKAVYLVPTIHNPTTVTMPLSRREEVAETLRANDVLLLETMPMDCSSRQPCRSLHSFPSAHISPPAFSRRRPFQMHCAGPARVLSSDTRPGIRRLDSGRLACDGADTGVSNGCTGRAMAG